MNDNGQNGRSLPDSWEWSTLADCVDILDGRRVPINSGEREERIAGKEQSELIPYYGATGHVGWIDDFIFDEEILLLGEDAAPFLELTKNKAYVVRGKSWVNNHAHVLRAKSGITTNLFLMHYLNIFDYREYVTGTTRLKLNQGRMRVMPVPLPPLPEQERMVNRIEELLSDLDAGVAALERVRAGLKRYKASVLKAAITGKLLNGKLETVQGELPESWQWVKLEDVAKMRLGKMLDKEKNKGELKPYIRNINVRWFEFDLSDIQFMRVLNNELENISVRKGDLVVCEGGEPGRAAVWNKDEPVIIQKALHRVRLNDDVLPTYVLYCLSADAQTGRLEKYFTGSTIKHFTGQSLRTYKFILPPLDEQRRIVAEVERRLSVVGEVESAVEVGLVRAGRLRQSVLRSAFEGRLAQGTAPLCPYGKYHYEIRSTKTLSSFHPFEGLRLHPTRRVFHHDMRLSTYARVWRGCKRGNGFE
ncbi:MAG: restriction endonuclease subunit S [Anaerolineales bacterium]